MVKYESPKVEMIKVMSNDIITVSEFTEVSGSRGLQLWKGYAGSSKSWDEYDV